MGLYRGIPYCHTRPILHPKHETFDDHSGLWGMLRVHGVAIFLLEVVLRNCHELPQQKKIICTLARVYLDVFFGGGGVRDGKPCKPLKNKP